MANTVFTVNSASHMSTSHEFSMCPKQASHESSSWTQLKLCSPDRVGLLTYPNSNHQNVAIYPNFQ